jgi:O-antigen ligase
VPWLALVLGFGAIVMFGVVLSGAWSNRQALLAVCRACSSGFRGLDDRLVLVITAGATVLVYVAVDTLPSLVALGFLALILMLRPEMGLPMIALALPFYQLGRPLLGKVFSMVEILTVLTAAGWAANWAIGTRQSGTRSGVGGAVPTDVRLASRVLERFLSLTAVDWGVIALVVIGAASLFWAEYMREAARVYRTVVLEGALFYGLLRAMTRHRRDAWRVADAWVLGGALIALVGLGQWILAKNLITAEDVWRVRGFYGSPNNLALYLGRILPLGVAIAAWGRGRQRRWAYGLAALVMATGILLSQSRGAWLIGVPVALLFVAAVRGRRAFSVALGLLLLIAVFIVLVFGPGRLTTLLDMGEGTTFFRIQLWQSSWTMARDHPLLGVGLDNFLYHYRTYYVLPTAWEEFNLSHPHNLVLDFWLSLGVIGLAVAIWLLVSFFRRAWKAYRRLPEGNTRLLVLGLMGGMINVVAHGLVDNAFFLVDLAFALMLMLALVQVVQCEWIVSQGQDAVSVP